MTDHQLITRLNRITNPQKLACFIRVAREKQVQPLFALAQRRATDLGYYDIVDYIPVSNFRTEKSKKKKVTKEEPAPERDNMRTIHF